MRKPIFIILLVCLLPWVSPHSFGQQIFHRPKAFPFASSVNLFKPPDYRVQLIKDFVKNYNPRLDLAARERIAAEILDAAEEFRLDPFLVTAVIAAESSFYPRATSLCGAQGLMQLTRIVQPSLGVSNPFDIRQNIHGGCKFLAELHRRFGDTVLALAAYNAGPTRVARLRRVPRIRETQRYIARIQTIASGLNRRFLATVGATPADSVACLNNLPLKQVKTTLFITAPGTASFSGGSGGTSCAAIAKPSTGETRITLINRAFRPVARTGSVHGGNYLTRSSRSDVISLV